MSIQDHAGLSSASVTIPSFVFGTTLDAICDHPDLTVPSSECEALVEIYVATNGGSWWERANWLQTVDVDEWHGVRT